MKTKVKWENIERIDFAYQAFKGTKNYYKYLMYAEFKMDGRWNAYSVSTYPRGEEYYVMDSYIKTTKNGEWLYVEYRNGLERYFLNEDVKELLMA